MNVHIDMLKFILQIVLQSNSAVISSRGEKHFSFTMIT